MDPRAGRPLSIRGFLAIVIGDLVLLQGVSRLFGIHVHTGPDARLPTVDAMARNQLFPLALGLVYTVSVITWLRWWPLILSREQPPVRRWVRWIPASMIVAALICLNYGHLARLPAGFTLCLILLGIMVGLGEELMFRGVGVTVFRRNDFSEARVALFSSLLFGAVHLSNAIAVGSRAIVQAAIVSTTGYFQYLAMRYGRTILLPILMHGLWDAAIFSSLIGPHPVVYAGAAAILLAQAGLIVLVFVRRRKVEPVTG